MKIKPKKYREMKYRLSRQEGRIETLSGLVEELRKENKELKESIITRKARIEIEALKSVTLGMECVSKLGMEILAPGLR